MPTEKEPLQVRLPKGSGQKLKIVAAKKNTSISALVQEALALWWPQQPEAKTEGPLFPVEAPNPPEPKATAAVKGAATPDPQKAAKKSAAKTTKR